MSRPSALNFALEYRLRGWRPIPVPLGSKNPGRKGWQDERLDEAEIRERFAEPCNIGVLLGEPSGGLTDIDLDCDETRLLAHAFLPESKAIFGRPASPGSHVLYKARQELTTKRYQDPSMRGGEDSERSVLVEIRSTGTHTVFPGSLHPSGEEITWLRNETPLHIDGTDLVQAVNRLAAAALLARHWPSQGSRQDTALALAGTLLRAGWAEEEARDFIRNLTSAAGDEESGKRGEAAVSTAQQLREHKQATGLPVLRTHMDQRVVDRAMEWLGISGRGDREDDEAARGRRSQADDLVEIGSKCLLFTDSHSNPMAGLTVAGHREVWPLKSQHFKNWLRREYWQTYSKAPGSDAVNASIGVLEGLARFDGEQHSLHNRAAMVGDQLYYDLTNREWSAVVVTKQGWYVESEPPVLFRRYAHQLEQVLPVPGGDPWRLFDFLNVKETDRLLLLTWLITSFVPDIPRPILHFYGQKGAAKSTGQRVLRRLIDPSVAETLSLPTDKAELVQQLSHNYAPVYDNLDSLSPQVSDTFCRAVTGDAFTKRELFSDDDDFIYSFRRVLLLNGINIAAQRADLLDRMILIELARVTGELRRTESDFWRAFDAMRPQLLGGIFDVLVRAMAVVDTLQLPAIERMADFTRYGAAIAQALGRQPQELLAAYHHNLKRQSLEALEASPVGRVLLAFMQDRDGWSGTGTELLRALEMYGCETGLLHRNGNGRIADRGWPGAPHILSRRIAELESNLMENGISVVSHGGETRSIEIFRREGGAGSVSSVSGVIDHGDEWDATDATDGTDATFGSLEGEPWKMTV